MITVIEHSSQADTFTPKITSKAPDSKLSAILPTPSYNSLDDQNEHCPISKLASTSAFDKFMAANFSNTALFNPPKTIDALDKNDLSKKTIEKDTKEMTITISTTGGCSESLRSMSLAISNSSEDNIKTKFALDKSEKNGDKRFESQIEQMFKDLSLTKNKSNKISEEHSVISEKSSKRDMFQKDSKSSVLYKKKSDNTTYQSKQNFSANKNYQRKSRNYYDDYSNEEEFVRKDASDEICNYKLKRDADHISIKVQGDLIHDSKYKSNRFFFAQARETTPVDCQDLPVPTMLI